MPARAARIASCASRSCPSAASSCFAHDRRWPASRNRIATDASNGRCRPFRRIRDVAVRLTPRGGDQHPRSGKARAWFGGSSRPPFACPRAACASRDRRTPPRRRGACRPAGIVTVARRSTSGSRCRSPRLRRPRVDRVARDRCAIRRFGAIEKNDVASLSKADQSSWVGCSFCRSTCARRTSASPRHSRRRARYSDGPTSPRASGGAWHRAPRGSVEHECFMSSSNGGGDRIRAHAGPAGGALECRVIERAAAIGSHASTSIAVVNAAPDAPITQSYSRPVATARTRAASLRVLTEVQGRDVFEDPLPWRYMKARSVTPLRRRSQEKRA